jgi:phytoene dehydrogenase-like protein
MKKDKKYFIIRVLPWLFRYLFTIGKIERLKEPVKQYLTRFSTNQSLIEIITQHFFKDTPTFFALGYFQLYLNYYYPKGGTRTLPDKIKAFISDSGVQIQINTEIKAVNPEQHQLSDQNGDHYSYGKLIWAADLKTLYNIIDIDSIKDSKTKMNIISRKRKIADKKGGDSIFTLYLSLDLNKQYFSGISSEHFFYTPYSRGLLGSATIDLSSKDAAMKSLLEFFKYNTYEISCPALRDGNLAPAGKTGLIISTLFDYSVTEAINNAGWYDEFKIQSENIIIDSLNETIYPGIKDKIICRFSATPLTLFKKHGNSEGAITGWGFNNREIPVETRLIKIAHAIKTPVRDIFQAGQWAFSPSGIPVSIITGKLAADKVRKNM